MAFAVALTLVATAYGPLPAALRPAVAGLRASVPRAAAEPFRSDANFDYFRVRRDVSVTLSKPLGAELEEGKTVGVLVAGVQDGGSAAETGLLKKGDRLKTVMGTDVSEASFDEVMDLLIAAPEDVQLDVTRIMISRRPKAAAPVLTINGKPCTTTKGVIMKTAIQDNKFELFKTLMAKANQCGGGGQCATCWVNVVDGADNLSPRTAVEDRKGKKKPETYRLSCQAVVNGDATVEIPD